MKYAFVLAALAAAVSAQGDTGIPTCAVECLRSAVASASTCADGDYVCTCTPANNQAIRTAATPCVIAQCGVEVALNEVLPASEALCARCGTGACAPAQSSSAPAPPPAASSSSAPAPPPAGTTTSAPAPPASSGAATVTTVVTSTSTHGCTKCNGTSPSTSSKPPTPTAGAAMLGSIGGAAMLALGALAL